MSDTEPVETPVHEQPPPETRCGLAVLVGRTNVGKSTLLNALVGRKVSIVTPKPQTTRDPIQGVVNRPEGQIVFVDTPGFFKTHANRLVERLHERARRALQGIDVVVHVVDPSRAIGPEDEMVWEALQGVTQPRLLCLNKSDLPERPYVDAWKQRRDQYAGWYEVSAYTGQGLEDLVQGILQHLPVGPRLYPEDQITNAHQRFLIGEIIREKVYLLMDEEVPYRTAVEVHAVEESRDRQGRPMYHIKASILAANPRYQRMLIGAGGRRIREIGQAARVDLEAQLGRKVFLDMDVLVDRSLDR
ncbi:GTPase Era [Limisphaera ngatamarikiensis]|jgi:GTP-binding protein Era|uniref:GTPase Era n=1 Tax=Limisphaera ngatamarikiensis TaxID=1324935 RepID=A0A6M1RHG5_9BACT|nr:GTPase Era [Limisphaera ngatamarikiensis]NGO39508.1 GTPase Era [Limisphaera ngatamarikiensis]